MPKGSSGTNSIQVLHFQLGAVYWPMVPSQPVAKGCAVLYYFIIKWIIYIIKWNHLLGKSQLIWKLQTSENGMKPPRGRVL